MKLNCSILGIVTLAAAWISPLPALTQHSFAAHMSLHVLVIAIAAPLLAAALAGSRYDPVRVRPSLFAPLPACLVELVVVWTWHLPLLHTLARQMPGVLLLEQASFLASGLLLWLAALGGSPVQRRRRGVTGVASLLLTAMHMALLGVLLALAGRVLYMHAHATTLFGMTPLEDQQLGGVIMLAVGGASCLAGALARLWGLLQERQLALAAD